MTIDLSSIYSFFALPMDEQLCRFLVYFGWIPIAWVVLYGAKELWIDYIQGKWVAKQKFILLAIDIQRGNEQSIKAVENLFTYFGGGHKSISLIEKYWDGMFQLGFSFEIVSIEGYTQFLIHTPEVFRNFVETAVYSQYPDAEITEVDDYTEGIPTKYPDDEYDIWGGEFIYSDNEAYPIKTYKEFEDASAARPEHQFKDPMASLMDLCSSLGTGEQLWYQLIAIPTDFKWTKELNKEVSKILNEKVQADKGPFAKLLAEIKTWIDEFTTQTLNWSMGTFAEAEQVDDSLKMMNLKPQEKKKVEAIQNKISKIAFQAKSRMIYVAKKENMNKPKVVNGFVGYIKQFTDLDLNGLKPDMEKTATVAAYFFKDSRINHKKIKVMAAYKKRSDFLGRLTKIFNIEELATLWHFPIESVVKAPLIQKASGRKSEPPMSLPFSEGAVDEVTSYSEDEDIFGGADLKENGVDQNQKDKGKITDKSDLDEIFTIKEDFSGKYPVKKIKTMPAESKSSPPANLPFA